MFNLVKEAQSHLLDASAQQFVLLEVKLEGGWYFFLSLTESKTSSAFVSPTSLTPNSSLHRSQALRKLLQKLCWNLTIGTGRGLNGQMCLCLRPHQGAWPGSPRTRWGLWATPWRDRQTWSAPCWSSPPTWSLPKKTTVQKQHTDARVE